MTDPMTVRARRLRRDMTEAEKRLWRLLRSSAFGVKFRRQHAIGPYIVDFCAPAAFLVIELDGGQHAVATPFEEERTKAIKAEGYRLLRLWNNEVLGNADGVMQSIASELSQARSGSSSGS